MPTQATIQLHSFSKFRIVSGFVILLLLFPQLTYGAVGDIGWWRDCVGGQIPGTTFSNGFDFDRELRNDGIYTKPDNATIEFDEAGDYLITATIRGVDTSNGRYNPQARASLTSGSGTLFTSHATGFSRDNSENVNWTRVTAVVIGASADARVQIQRRRDSDTPTSGSVACESDVQVVRINPTNYGLYAFGGTSATLGGTSPNTVNITTVTAESDTAVIEGNTSTETVTVKGDSKRYLVAWSVSGDTGGNRTQRIGHLEYDGTDNLPTRSYCYQRSSANEYCGIGSVDILETDTANIDIQAEVFLGPDVIADAGGGDDNGSFTEDGLGQMIVLELPDSTEVFRSHDSTGLQDITSPVTLNAMRDVDFNDSASFTAPSNTVMDVTGSADVFVGANVWTARNNVSSAARLTAYGNVTINGTATSTGEHGNYTRGNQGSQDTFAGSFHPSGIFAVSTGDDIGIQMTDLAGGEAGGSDRTQANTVGFFAINLDTLTGGGGASAPTVETLYASTVDSDSAILNGEVTYDGGATVTQHGFAYSTDSTLSSSVSTTTLGSLSPVGQFSDTAVLGSTDTVYYFRAYATNSAGTSYGTVRSLASGNNSITRSLLLFGSFTLRLIEGRIQLNSL